MSEALETLRPLAQLDANKSAYVCEHLDSLINTPSNRFDQSLLTWLDELYEPEDAHEELG